MLGFFALLLSVSAVAGIQGIPAPGIQGIPAPKFGFTVRQLVPKAFAAASPNVPGEKILKLTRQKSSSLARHFWSNATSTSNHTKRAKPKGYGLSILSPAEGGLQFIADITFGNQTLQAAVDTGSSDTWVVASNFQCVDLNTYTFAPQSDCAFGPTLYNASPPFVPNENFNVSYGGGDFVLGLLENATVHIGGVSVQNQTFGVVGLAATYWDNVSAGLIGLAYPSLTSAYTGYDPSLDSEYTNIPYNGLFTNMYTQGLISPMFSLAIDREFGGYLAFGGLPPVTWRLPIVTLPIQIVALSGRQTFAMDYSFYTVVPQGFSFARGTNSTTSPSSVWNWLLTVFNINQAALSKATTNFPVIVDSGTTLTYLPQQLADAVNAAFTPPSYYDPVAGGYFVDCNAIAPTFGVNLGGSIFYVQGQDLIVNNGYGTCASGIQDSGSGPAILGDSFLKNVLVIFDVGASQIRFAARTAADNPTNPATSEDCLFLDLYAPSNASDCEPLPVYFFIQGGGFNTNSNANYNGSGLIEASGMNIVVVNFNYRVGPYGFLAGQEIVDGGSLNNGLKDQRKALQWVQRYISRFGGDPNHVVIGGDSAGAQSVDLHVTAYGGRNEGLFHGSAAESQSFSALRTVNDSQFAYNNLVVRTGCVNQNDTLACLRSLNATFLQENNINTPFPGAQNPPLYMYGPTLDYDFITDYTYRLYAEGKFVRVPAIAGDDTNEGTVFTPKNTSTIGQSDTFLQDAFPTITFAQLARINELYPIAEQFNGTGLYWRQVSNAYGDMRYTCPGVTVSQTYSRYGVPNWNYHWNVVDPTEQAEGLGVPHTVEINAIWGPTNVNGGAPASYFTSNAGIVPVAQGYWTSFIRTLNPNTYRYPGSPLWGDWGTSGGYQRLRFQTNDTAMESVPEYMREQCAYLASIGVSLHQ